jgi:PAS domain S-box-containing protein
MADSQKLQQQINRARQRAEELLQRVSAQPADIAAVLHDALDEQIAVLEELQVSEEELRRRSDELASTVEALETERRRYRELFESAPDAYIVTDRFATIQEANRQAAQLLGVAAHRLDGRSLRGFVVRENRGEFVRLLADVVAGERSHEHEIRVMPRNGDPVPVAVTAAAVRKAGEVVTSIRWLMRDITDPRQSAEALARSEAQARAFLETAPVGVVIVDAAGTIVSANLHLEQIFGYPRGALTGQPLERLIPERLRAAHVAHRAGYFEAPRSRPMGIGLDLVGRRADGGELPIEVSLSFVHGTDGGLAIAFVSDVTRRREAECRLRAEFAVTRALLDASTVLDVAPRIVRAACEFLGWEVGELWLADGDDGVLRWQGLWHAGDLSAEALTRASKDLTIERGRGLPGRVWAEAATLWVPDLDAETDLRRRESMAALGLRAALGVPVRNGEAVVGAMLFFSRTAYRPDGEVLQIMNDIGTRVGAYIEHKHVQDALARQQQALHRSEKLASLGTLTAGLAHELNNPLGIISSRIEIMLMESQDHGLPARVVEDLEVVHRNIQRVTRLGQALRAFSRQSPQQRVPVDLNAVVDETVLLVRKTYSTEGIEITTELDLALPQMSGDSNALQQVVLNLIGNAREAMSGGGSIRMRTEGLPGEPPRVRLTISDTGPGIAQDVLPRIFDPFYTTKLHGTGLGLSVSYGIVQDHQGTVDVETAPGRGTSFILTFPALA